jgi:ABC-type amino acid transport system permease subunit
MGSRPSQAFVQIAQGRMTLSVALGGVVVAPVRAFVWITLSVALGSVVAAPVRAFVRIARGCMILSVALGKA